MEDGKTGCEFISDTIKDLEKNILAKKADGRVFSPDDVVHILENLRKWIVELAELTKEQ